MKLKIQLLLGSLLLTFACTVLGSCDQNDWEWDYTIITDESHGSLTNNRVVATGDAINVTSTSATILCSVNNNFKELFGIKPGIIYSTSKNDLKCGAPNTTQIEVKDFTSSEVEVNLDNLNHGTTYYYRTYAIADGKEHYSDVKSFTTLFDFSTLEGVDLGLSVKWADHNIGSSQPEENGVTFYWGETKASTSKDWHEFALSTLMSHGYIDANNNLCPAYDTATEIWGNKWRMPTKDEFQELKDKCTWKKVNKNGHSVFLITGPNGNFIYLPFGYHWSSTCNSNKSYCLYTSDRRETSVLEDGRSEKNLIRPVMK